MPIAYVLALKHRHNCSAIESFQPGQEAAVLVVPENDQTTQLVTARARRSQDGTYFIVTMPDGEETKWGYASLTKETIPIYKPAQ